MASPAPVDPVADEDPLGPLLLKLRARDGLTEPEADVLRGAVDRVETVAAGDRLVTAGEPLDHSILLIEGVICRYKDLAEGQRQITDVHVPGDFVDLHGFLLKRLEHHVGTLTPGRVAIFPHAALKEITETQPHLARLLWLSTLIDAAMQRERILSIGRRSAVARIAHLICELHVRYSVVHQVEGTSFRFPVTQLDMADATGLTSVHVNRMLRQLRDENMVTFRGGVIEIHDLPRLEQVAEFDPSYLFLTSEPR